MIEKIRLVTKFSKKRLRLTKKKLQVVFRELNRAHI